jgi:hypothetical protein
MSKIIVSYRRADSQAVAGRIVDRLISHFGPDAVFMDVDNIPFGIDFRDHIHAVLSKAAVLIAIVGPDWLGIDADKHRRIDDEDDPVRVELETALKQKLLVIPVLVNNAGMPKANTLPESLRGFSFLNAAPVDVGRDFRPHVDRLIRSIETALSPGAAPATHGGTDALAPAAAATQPARGNSMLIAAGVAIAVGGGAWWWFGAASSRSSGDAPPMAKVADAPSPAATAMSAPSSQNRAGKIEPTPSSAPGLTATPTALPPAPPAPAPSADDIRWDVLKDTSDVGLLLRFVEQYPDSKHRADAEHRIAVLAAQHPPEAAPEAQAGIMPVPSSAPAAPTPAADPSDERDWAQIQKVNSYEAYQAYVRRHPQGAHVADAVKAAVENALIAEPAIGRLPTGETVLVDDRVCNADHIKAITGGDVNKGISRTKKCVPRSNPF